MNIRQVLKEYVDACELLKETEKDIQKLQKFRQTTTTVNVKGSMKTHPYIEQHKVVTGVQYSEKNERQLAMEERLLEERKQKTQEIKIQAQRMMNEAPIRIQRIIRYRYIEGLSWNRVADRMGRGSSEDSLRMELDRFFQKK